MALDGGAGQPTMSVAQERLASFWVPFVPVVASSVCFID
jgi:hypothetical protein